MGMHKSVAVLVTLCLAASPPRRPTMALKLPRKFNSRLDMYRARVVRVLAQSAVRSEIRQ